MIARLWELITGRPWTTGRSMRAEFGDPPAVRYPELAAYSDAELYARPLADIIRDIEADRSRARRRTTRTTRQEVTR